jgi:hypothetical protein
MAKKDVNGSRLAFATGVVLCVYVRRRRSRPGWSVTRAAFDLRDRSVTTKRSRYCLYRFRWLTARNRL